MPSSKESNQKAERLLRILYEAEATYPPGEKRKTLLEQNLGLSPLTNRENQDITLDLALSLKQLIREGKLLFVGTEEQLYEEKDIVNLVILTALGRGCLE